MLEKVKNREKAEKDRKGGFDLELDFLQRNALLLEMLITFERKVPQRSDASQNDHKSKGYPFKTLALKLAERLSNIILFSSNSNRVVLKTSPSFNSFPLIRIFSLFHTSFVTPTHFEV